MRSFLKSMFNRAPSYDRLIVEPDRPHFWIKKQHRETYARDEYSQSRRDHSNNPDEIPDHARSPTEQPTESGFREEAKSAPAFPGRWGQRDVDNDDTISGTWRSEVLIGNSGDNVFEPKEGIDAIFGGRGYDSVRIDAFRDDVTAKKTDTVFGPVVVLIDRTDGFGRPNIKLLFGVEEIQYIGENQQVSQIGVTEAPTLDIFSNDDGEARIGLSVRSAGDVNGDGYDDVIIAAPETISNGVTTGAAYVVFGNQSGADIDLEAIAQGNGGFAIYGIEGSFTGSAVSGAGDVNGDGLADLIVGAQAKDNETGGAYVVFGKPTTETVDLAAVTQDGNTEGFFIKGPAERSLTGNAVAYAGDVNGDGKADVVLSAPTTNSNTGAAYIVYGKSDGSAVDLATDLAGLGFSIADIATEAALEISIGGLGDFNGDGFDDVILGAPATNNREGAAYIVFGSDTETNTDTGSLAAGQGGRVLLGTDSFGSAAEVGYSVSGLGDINNDGLGDAVVGSPKALDNDGVAFVVYGSASTSPLPLNANPPASDGFLIRGGTEGGQLGSSVSGAGDVNNDGYFDIVLASPAEAPGTYVVFGGVDPNETPVELSIDGGEGFFRIAAPGGSVFFSASGAGDFNGDGFGDVITGFPTNGSAVIAFGGPPNSVGWVGTTGNDKLFNTPAAYIAGKQGNDLIWQDPDDAQAVAAFGSKNGGTGNDDFISYGLTQTGVFTFGEGTNTLQFSPAISGFGFEDRVVIVTDMFETPFDGTGGGGTPIIGENLLSYYDFLFTPGENNNNPEGFKQTLVNSGVANVNYNKDVVSVIELDAFRLITIFRNAEASDFDDVTFFGPNLAQPISDDFFV